MIKRTNYWNYFLSISLSIKKTHPFSWSHFIFLALLAILFKTTIALSSPPPTPKKRPNKATATPKAPLIDKALQEINKIKNKQNSINNKNPEPSGIFTVQAPQTKITDRTWKYVMGLKVQSLKPSGKVPSSLVGDFNLNEYHHQVFPSLEMGLGKKYEDLAPWSDWSLLAQFGFSAAQTPTSLKTSYRKSDNTRFNVLKTNIGLETQRPISTETAAFYKAGLSLGKFFFSQTSLNDLAQFSENLSFFAVTLGLNYSLLDNFYLSGDYIFRSPLQQSTLQLQNHNFELGLRVLW